MQGLARALSVVSVSISKFKYPYVRNCQINHTVNEPIHSFIPNFISMHWFIRLFFLHLFIYIKFVRCVSWYRVDVFMLRMLPHHCVEHRREIFRVGIFIRTGTRLSHTKFYVQSKFSQFKWCSHGFDNDLCVCKQLNFEHEMHNNILGMFFTSERLTHIKNWRE